jgi:hypothetical protein
MSIAPLMVRHNHILIRLSLSSFTRHTFIWLALHVHPSTMVARSIIKHNHFLLRLLPISSTSRIVLALTLDPHTSFSTDFWFALDGRALCVLVLHFVSSGLAIG